MKYLIFTGADKNDLFGLLMEDLKNDARVTLNPNVPQIPDNLDFLWRLHHKYPLPFQNIWAKYAPIEEKIFETEPYCLVFNNVSICRFEPSLLIKWKKKYNVKLVLYLLDVLDSYYCKDVRRILAKTPFDKIYTFYKADALQQGFTYFDTYYSSLSPDKSPDAWSGTKTDLFFWGTDGGRRKMIESVYDVFSAAGYQTNFGICYADENSHKPGITYNQPIPYPEVLRRISDSRCILDIVGDYSKGVSLRYFEALTQGKKLITNNPLVKDMRLYNPAQVLVFENPSDIDPAFLELPFENSYNNEFSPLHWIDHLI